MADVSVQNERINGWIPSSATNVIMNWPERIKTQPHDDRDNCFLHFDSKGPCGMTVNNDIDDDSATKHGDSHMSPRAQMATDDSSESSPLNSTPTSPMVHQMNCREVRVVVRAVLFLSASRGSAHASCRAPRGPEGC